ncbi:restriction endonuclease subunit S [Thioclava sp. F36-6]|uniref:restriction endonuclease subunit S n=1 Tax=Thioclava sp. F36-6 TaxID=1915316 RepID=UPI00099607ED|nr:restriction endonuclease subunit S [Thioclava sp. F36-6]OOY31259.1 hypothetical protein BMI88_09060 [Thioclava sp. F36-6]
MRLDVIDNHRSRFVPVAPGWRQRKMRFAVKRYQTKKNKDENPTVLSLTKTGLKVKTDLAFGKSTENYIGHQIVERGQFVFTPRDFDATPILCGVADTPGCISNLYIVFDVSAQIDARFLEYYFWGLKHGFEFFEKLSFGMRYSFNRMQFENIPLLYPDLSTQRQIADFLDRETARIDLLIEKKQRLVALVGEQRSAAISSAVTVGLADGADLVPTNSQYLPHVPATWRVWRLKHLAEIRGGLTLGRTIPDDVETTLTPYMRVANVQAGWLDLGDVAEIPVTKLEKQRYRLQGGDVLMNEGGDNDKLGRGAVWKSEIETCVHQNHVFAVRPHDIRYSDWISLATNARYARDFFFLHSNQSTNLASISKTNLARFPVAVPPFDEMRTTLNALRLRAGKLDRITEKTSVSIDRLKEYRSALITAAVTGQIDVATYARSGTPDSHLDTIQEEMGA